MMSHDVIMSEAVLPDNLSRNFQPDIDERWKRDEDKDLHELIDLARMFSKEIKLRHPMAIKNIRTLIAQGDFL